MSNTPSDAEIWRMWMPMARMGVADPVEFARAVLAKWGTPQPAPLSDDSALLDWIATHGSFGVDSSTGEVGGNGQKRVAATRKNIRAAIAAQGGNK